MMRDISSASIWPSALAAWIIARTSSIAFCCSRGSRSRSRRRLCRFCRALVLQRRIGQAAEHREHPAADRAAPAAEQRPGDGAEPADRGRVVGLGFLDRRLRRALRQIGDRAQHLAEAAAAGAAGRTARPASPTGRRRPAWSSGPPVPRCTAVCSRSCAAGAAPCWSSDPSSFTASIMVVPSVIRLSLRESREWWTSGRRQPAANVKSVSPRLYSAAIRGCQSPRVARARPRWSRSVRPA